MDYQKVYNQLIDKAKHRGVVDGYSETHHIVPKCIGGEDKLNNLVELTAREHFIAHWLLYRIYPNNKDIAYSFTAFQMDKYGNRYKLSSRTIGEIREARVMARRGTKHTEETKRKISQSNKGKAGTWKYKEMSDAMRQKMSEAKLGRCLNSKHKKKISEGKKEWYKHNTHPNAGKSLEGNYYYDRNSLEEKRLSVKKLYDEGTPISHIVKQIPISRQAIYNWIKEYKWER